MYQFAHHPSEAAKGIICKEIKARLLVLERDWVVGNYFERAEEINRLKEQLKLYEE